MVTVVRQRLPHALRSAHSVAIHSEKSDAKKGRCPGRCQEAHRPHSDAYRLDHLVRFSLAPLELASFGAGAVAMFLRRLSKATRCARCFPKLLRLTQVYNRQKKAWPMGQAFPPFTLTISLSYARSLIGNAGILSVAILRRLKGRLE